MKKVMLLMLLLAVCMGAFAYRVGYGNNIIISKPVYEDFYIAGGNITINAPVYGDLIIAGGTIVINDTVTSDILLAGGNVSFNGFVGDDIRCAGGNIHISGNVAGDVVSSGGTIIIDQGVTIGGLMASGGNITINGTVSGAIKGAFGELQLNGTAEKDLDCRGRKITINGSVGGKSLLSATDIIIGSNAAFNNDIRYWNKKGSVDFKQSVKNGTATFDPSLRIQTGEWYYLGAITVLGLLWYLAMVLLMIMIVQYLFSATFQKAAGIAFNSTLKSLGSGFLFFIAVPVLSVIAFITVAGVPVGLILLFGYIILALLATIITAAVTANWFNNRREKKWRYWKMVFAAFGIFIVLKSVSLIPFVGFVVTAIMICIAFGSILLQINWKRKKTTEPIPAPVQ
jgi:cytoskeletal protein CcmA (bactofilin family)